MKFIFIIINLILLTLSVFFSVDLMYAELEDALSPQPSLTGSSTIKPSRPGNQTFQARPLAEYQDITQRNIFNVTVRDAGPATSAAPALESNLDNLEQTDLELKLWGTVTGSGQVAFAVIEDKKARKQELYREGDTVLGAGIKKILREKVVLTHNNKDQVLEMSLESSPPAARTLTSLPGEPKKEGGPLLLDRSMITEQTKDINALMRQVRVRPHFSKGKPDGLLLYGIKNDSLFEKMGLKNGDIIMGVDGNTIKSVDDALSLYNNLTSASDVRMQIKRRGNIEEINYHVQ